MRKFFFLILILSLTMYWISPSQAESVKQYGGKGQQGIVLLWNGSWDIGEGTFEGGIGYKHWINNLWALKSYLTLAKTNLMLVVVQDGYPMDEYRIRETSASLLTGLEDHFWNKSRLSFFWGSGILFKTSSSRTDNVSEEPIPDDIKEIKSNKNIWGIQNTLGVECFLFKWLSLSGQYQLDFSLEKESRKNIFWGASRGTQTYRQKITTWELGIGTSALVLTIYL